jgi:hypothetical protein
MGSGVCQERFCRLKLSSSTSPTTRRKFWGPIARAASTPLSASPSWTITLLSPLLFHQWTFGIKGWAIPALPPFLIYFIYFSFHVLINAQHHRPMRHAKRASMFDFPLPILIHLLISYFKLSIVISGILLLRVLLTLNTTFLIDDYSHYTRNFPLRFKSDGPFIVHAFYHYVLTQFCLPIQSVKCDNSREFNNTDLRSFFSSKVVPPFLPSHISSKWQGRMWHSHYQWYYMHDFVSCSSQANIWGWSLTHCDTKSRHIVLGSSSCQECFYHRELTSSTSPLPTPATTHVRPTTSHTPGGPQQPDCSPPFVHSHQSQPGSKARMSLHAHTLTSGIPK